MARTVREIMNPELLSISDGARGDQTIDLILEFGVTAVPVLDGDGKPIGVTSLRDLVAVGPARAPMTSPATTISLGATVESAGETMASTGRHHLVVVGADGRAVGMVSSIDVVRGLLGLPVKHPGAFPGYDRALDGLWSSEETLDEQALSVVPELPGVLLLLRAAARGVEDAVVWCDATTDLRGRAREILSRRPEEPAVLLAALGAGPLRVRWSVAPDPQARERICGRLRARMASAPPPGGT